MESNNEKEYSFVNEKKKHFLNLIILIINRSNKMVHAGTHKGIESDDLERHDIIRERHAVCRHGLLVSCRVQSRQMSQLHCKGTSIDMSLSPSASSFGNKCNK